MGCLPVRFPRLCRDGDVAFYVFSRSVLVCVFHFFAKNDVSGGHVSKVKEVGRFVVWGRVGNV